MAGGPRIGMRKWWKSHEAINGLIVRQLSPFEQKVISPLFKDFAKKTKARFTDNMYTVFPAFIGLYGLVKWSDYENDQVHRRHWN